MSRKPPCSISSLISKCTSIRPLSQIHAQMILTSRILHDNFATSRLLLSYSSLNHLPFSLLILTQTPSPNSFMYNSLIRAFSLSSSPSASFSLYSHMLHNSVWPGKHTYPFLLKACSNIKSCTLCEQVHLHVLRHSFHEDEYVVNGLIHAYACSAKIADARKVFDEMSFSKKNCMIWTTMVSGYVKNDSCDNAICLFEEMVCTGLDVCDATLSTVLSACTRSSRGLEVGRKVHEEFVKGKGVILGTALVDMYAKNGAILEAREVFNKMEEKNTATWNAMICGYAHHGYSNESLDLFKEMERLNVRPNDITFTGVLKACCHGRYFELGREIFESMNEKYGIEPKKEHYGCTADILGRSGKLEEAEKLVKGMKCEADVAVWGALLTACRDHGNIEIAERVVGEILKLDSSNHSVFVLLSNMYAEVGKWDDVERFRKFMIGERLMKIPARSSINDRGDENIYNGNGPYRIWKEIACA